MVSFPEPALANADGLLAIGGDLLLPTLLKAYAQGCFPWYSEDQPILWWSPDPRMVLLLDDFYCSQRLARRLKQKRYRFSWDENFSQVINQCKEVHRKGGTWLLPDMITAYQALHQAAYAHSVEVWEGELLIGGLYGVLLDQVFFAESMFSIKRDASKMALAMLMERGKREGWKCIDCQFYTDHLSSLGAKEIPRTQFLELIRN
ncbi:MAG: leucyl/phenylalanyl-tRNA--protein transferase [Proteobacteria bacterium]|nr:MAG: leucyl/phenylalanyl-tRNA--protein transferase [Pseudomonadota bacterium]